jgi:hypothetical protein
MGIGLAVDRAPKEGDPKRAAKLSKAPWLKLKCGSSERET